MEFLNEETIKKILKENKLPALRKFGQNFLIDEDILCQIIESADLKKEDLVLEIGAGLGVLTKELAKRCQKVIAVEKDRRLIKLLKEKLVNFNNIEIIENDILKMTPCWREYKIVSNLPYNIALAVIKKFTESKNPPKEMILMLQKEVAERLCSQKGSLPKIALDFYAKTKYLFTIPKKAFYPQPKVDGAIIKIGAIQKDVPVVDKEQFFEILKTGFSYPRKTILNNLSQLKTKEEILVWFKGTDISPQKRPEELCLNDWVKLCNGFKK